MVKKAYKKGIDLIFLTVSNPIRRMTDSFLTTAIDGRTFQIHEYRFFKNDLLVPDYAEYMTDALNKVARVDEDRFIVYDGWGEVVME